MTVILMLSMFVVFLAIDYLMRKGKVTATESETGTEAAQSSPRMLPTIVGGFGVARKSAVSPGAYLGVAGKPDACTRGD
jgi:hypothetical protein